MIAAGSQMEQALYEYTDGARVSEGLRGQQVPIPTQEIRERLRLPAKYALASLAPEVLDTYNPVYRATVTAYLSAWPSYRARGLGPLLVGGMRTGASYIAAALANEIVTRSMAKRYADLNVSWLSCFWVLRLIQDARDLSRQDTYPALRDAMYKHDLLVVDDLLAAEHVPGGVPFMHTVYARRYDQNLPTVTTLTVPDGKNWQREVTRVYGHNFLDRLQLSTSGLVAHAHG
jgi:DNA replication protein DnaC